MYFNTAYTSSPFGNLKITAFRSKLINLEFIKDIPADESIIDPQCQKVIEQLTHYFKNPHHTFDIDYQLVGTPYQQKVWHALRDIPLGSTKTYKELALELKTGPRAIGNACRKNPLPIIFPCHRIVSTHGLGGYSGKTDGNMMLIKNRLLQHESKLHK